MALRVWTNNTETVIAESAADAQKVLEEQYGESYSEDLEWHVRPDDRPLKIMNFAGDDVAVTKTNAEWIASEGRGFLCTTEY